MKEDHIEILKALLWSGYGEYDQENNIINTSFDMNDEKAIGEKLNNIMTDVAPSGLTMKEIDDIVAKVTSKIGKKK